MQHDRLADERDELTSEAIEAVAERVHSPLDRAVLRATGWLSEHRILRVVFALAAMVLAFTPGVVLFFFSDSVVANLRGFGYLGVFLTNLASTSTVFIPVPGLTAAGQALIIKQGADARLPWLVGLAGGSGMGLGEVTAYYAGFLGAELARGQELPGPARFHGVIRRIFGWIDWLMDHYGMATLFVLSAVPNPLFEVAGITAGSVRMSFRRFFVAAVGGKIVRGILLAYLGDALPWV